MFGLIENPTFIAIVAVVALALRFVEFVIALRGTKPGQRAPIIRAMRSRRLFTRRSTGFHP